MKSPLNNLMIICIALHRHLSRSARIASVVVILNAYGCELGCDIEPDIVINRAPDADGDGVYEWDDCDDNDPNIGAALEGEECPLPVIECEDDPDCGIIVNPAPDADGDGVYEWDDCDDNDPNIGAALEGEEC